MNDKNQGKVAVALYTRPGCHLCEEAKAEMARADCSAMYVLEEINIDGDPALTRRYGYDIPVVVIGGAYAFKHRLAAADFRREVLRALESQS